MASKEQSNIEGRGRRKTTDIKKPEAGEPAPLILAGGDSAKLEASERRTSKKPRRGKVTENTEAVENLKSQLIETYRKVRSGEKGQQEALDVLNQQLMNLGVKEKDIQGMVAEVDKEILAASAPLPTSPEVAPSGAEVPPAAPTIETQASPRTTFAVAFENAGKIERGLSGGLGSKAEKQAKRIKGKKEKAAPAGPPSGSGEASLPEAALGPAPAQEIISPPEAPAMSREDIEHELFDLYLRKLPDIEARKKLGPRIEGRLEYLKKELRKAGGKPGEMRALAERVYAEPKEQMPEEIKAAIESKKQALLEAERHRYEEFIKNKRRNALEALAKLERAREELFKELRKTRWETVPDQMIYREIDRLISSEKQELLKSGKPGVKPEEKTEAGRETVLDIEKLAQLKQKFVENEAALHKVLGPEQYSAGYLHRVSELQDSIARYYESQKMAPEEAKIRAKLEIGEMMKNFAGKGKEAGKVVQKSDGAIDEALFGQARRAAAKRGGNIVKKPAKTKLSSGTLDQEMADLAERLETREKAAVRVKSAPAPENLPIAGEVEAKKDAEAKEQVEEKKDYKIVDKRRESIRKEVSARTLGEAPAKEKEEDIGERIFREAGLKEAAVDKGPFAVGFEDKAREEVPETKKESALEEKLNRARQAYIEAYKNYNRSREARLGFINRVLLRRKEPEEKKEERMSFYREMTLAKESYDASRAECAKMLYEERKNNLEKEALPAGHLGTLEEYRKEELDKHKAGLFERFIMKEKNTILQLQAENGSPKEKSIIRRMWDRWSHLDKYVRLGITSTLIGAGTAVWASGLAPAAILLGVGARVRRGARGMVGATGLGYAAQKGIEMIYGGTLKQVEEAGVAEQKREFNPEEFQSRLEQYENLLKALQRRRNIEVGVQLAAALAGGYFATAGVDMIEKHWFGSGTMPESQGGAASRMPETLESRPGVVGSEGLPEAPSPGTATEFAASKHLEELATIQKGEGVWHAVYRQLEENLHKNPAKFGLTQEQLEDAAKVKEVLNRQTGKLLVEQGYVRPDGTEIRLTKPGIKVFLRDNNQIEIEGGLKSVYEFKRPAAELPEDLKPFKGHESVTPEEIEPGAEAPKEVPIEYRGALGEDVRQYSGEGAFTKEIPIEYRGALGEDIRQNISAPESLPEFVNEAQKQLYFDRLFGATDGFLKEENIPELAKLIKAGKVSVEDLEKYAIGKGSVPLPPRTIEHLKTSFDIIADDNYSAEEKFQRMRNIRSFLRIAHKEMGFSNIVR